MKRFVFVLFLTLISGAAFAGDENMDCYNFVRDKLSNSPQFSNVLIDVRAVLSDVKIECVNNGRGMGAEPSDVKQGDKLAMGYIDAEIKLTIQPVVNGMKLGGTFEVIKVSGVYGNYWNTQDMPDWCDVDTLTYSKARIKEADLK